MAGEGPGLPGSRPFREHGEGSRGRCPRNSCLRCGQSLLPVPLASWGAEGILGGSRLWPLRGGGPFTVAKQVFMSTWECPLDWGQVRSRRPASAKRPTPCEAPPLPDPHSSLTPAGPVWNSRREDGRGSLLPLPQLPAGECLVGGGGEGTAPPPSCHSDCEGTACRHLPGQRWLVMWVRAPRGPRGQGCLTSACPLVCEALGASLALLRLPGSAA